MATTQASFCGCTGTPTVTLPPCLSRFASVVLFPPSALQSTVDPMVDVAVSSSSSTSYSAANVAAAAAAAAAVRSAHNFNKVGPCDLQAASKKI